MTHFAEPVRKPRYIGTHHGVPRAAITDPTELDMLEAVDALCFLRTAMPLSDERAHAVRRLWASTDPAERPAMYRQAAAEIDAVRAASTKRRR